MDFNSTELWKNAHSLYNQRKYDQSLIELNALSKEYPNAPLLLLFRADCHRLLFQFKEAVDDIDSAFLKFTPTSDTLSARAESHRMLGNFQLALEDIQAAIRLSIVPRSHLLLALSSTERSLGRYEEALAHSLESIKLEPSSSFVKMNLVSILLATKEYDSALAEALPLLNGSTTINFALYLYIGQAFNKKFQFLESKAWFEKCKEAFPQDMKRKFPPLWYWILMYSGINLQNNKLFIEALHHFELVDKWRKMVPYSKWLDSHELSHVRLTMNRMRCFSILRFLRLVSCISPDKRTNIISQKKIRDRHLGYLIFKTITNDWLEATQFDQFFLFSQDRGTFGQLNSRPNNLPLIIVNLR